MSVLNVVVSTERALIAVDTAAVGVAANGVVERFECSKLVPLVHLNVVIAMRGHLSLLWNIYSACHGVEGDFDALLDTMELRLQTCFERHPKADFAAVPGMPDRIAFVGYSPARQRIVAIEHLIEPSGQQTKREITSWTLQPGSCFTEANVPRPEAHWLATDEVVGLARAQVAHELAKDPGASFGGRLVVAEVTRRDMRITSHQL